MTAYEELIKRWKEAAILGSCGGLLGWDERTYMPRNGSAHRAEQMALIARLCHEMTTQPRVGELCGTWVSVVEIESFLNDLYESDPASHQLVNDTMGGMPST